MNGLPYYKAYPRDFIEGTVGMRLELKGAYRLVIDLIYLQGGNLPDDPRYISGLIGCTVRKWKSLRNELIDGGKLFVNGEFLSNERAVSELETSRKLRDKNADSARERWKNNTLPDANAKLTRGLKPEPEPEEDTLEANASNDGDAVEAEAFLSQKIDATKEAIWKRGVPFLTERGVPERQARSAIGKWLRDAGSSQLYDALAQAAGSGTEDPVPYITKVLQPEKNNSEVMADILSRVRAKRFGGADA